MHINYRNFRNYTNESFKQMVCPKYNKSAKPYDKMTFATLKGPFQY